MTPVRFCPADRFGCQALRSGGAVAGLPPDQPDSTTRIIPVAILVPMPAGDRLLPPESRDLCSVVDELGERFASVLFRVVTCFDAVGAPEESPSRGTGGRTRTDLLLLDVSGKRLECLFSRF